MRILAFPRDDSNPYQRLLYEGVRQQGVHVGYLGRMTPSHTLNLILLPLELVGRRLRGSRVVHMHWVHGFAMTGAASCPALRRISQIWFGICLAAMKLLGIRLVWTAHNVLPHEAVFADDLAARRRLVRACDLVLVHSQFALGELNALGLTPRRAAVTPHGPFPASPPAAELRPPGSGSGPRRLLFIGRVREYKGVTDLLDAFEARPGLDAQLVVAGECDDARLRSELVAAAARDSRVTLRLRRAGDRELSLLLGDADAVVLPFRRVTTSGSALLALSHGRPLVVPCWPALAELPGDAVLRYDGTTPGLAQALERIVSAEGTALAAMSAAAVRYTSAEAWPEIAMKTVAEMELLVAGPEGVVCRTSR